LLVCCVVSQVAALAASSSSSRKKLSGLSDAQLQQQGRGGNNSIIPAFLSIFKLACYRRLLFMTTAC
jgi:hypothetical protein